MFGTAAAVALVFTLIIVVGQGSGAELAAALIVVGLPALLVASVLTALGLLVFGLPMTWLLARLHRESGFSYSLAGTAAGSLAGLLYNLGAAVGSTAAVLLAGAAPGALCGWLWWRFARRGRQVRRTDVAGAFE